MYCFSVYCLFICLSVHYSVSSDGLSRDKVKSILLNIKLQLMTMAARPFTLALHQHYQTVASSVRTFPLVWACLPGEMIYTDGCGEVLVQLQDGISGHKIFQKYCVKSDYFEGLNACKYHAIPDKKKSPLI